MKEEDKKKAKKLRRLNEEAFEYLLITIPGNTFNEKQCEERI